MENNQLVIMQGKHALTNSLIVAEMFQKQHKNVLQNIEKLVADISDYDRLNFQPVEYRDAKGESRPMYNLTRDGFSLLAMGFTGKKALAWKLKFLHAFNTMEQALLNKQNLSWINARNIGKEARKLETGAIARFTEYARKQGSFEAGRYYANITSMTYKALFIILDKAPKHFRDTLNSMQINFLTTAEYLVHNALEDGMSKRMYYRDIYVLARNRVMYFAEQLPKEAMLIEPHNKFILQQYPLI